MQATNEIWEGYRTDAVSVRLPFWNFRPWKIHLVRWKSRWNSEKDWPGASKKLPSHHQSTKHSSKIAVEPFKSKYKEIEFKFDEKKRKERWPI